VAKFDALGRKTASEFWLRGQLVGRACWNPDGTPCLAVGVRDGVPVGHQLEFHERGVVYAEPFVDGKLHGLAKQFGIDGRLVLVSPFEHGTGTDFWWS
jgi:antitoxin component YwqK of YwqJK toxin-antitoxin module